MTEKLLTDAELAANGSAWAAGEREGCRIEEYFNGNDGEFCQDCECRDVCAAERGEA